MKIKKLICALIVSAIGLGSVSVYASASDETTTTKTRTSRSKSKSKSSKSSSKSSSSSSKRWKGASSIAEFKSKISGTKWGSTRKRGEFYWIFEIKNNKLYSTSYLRSDFNPASKIGGTVVADIEQWREKDGKAFAIVASSPNADKSSLGYVPTVLGFQKDGSGATWATIDGTIPLVQIL